MEQTSLQNTPASDGSMSLHGRNVLVLEDEPIILLNVSRALQRGGATVRRARTVAKALVGLAEGGIDAAILDVNMGQGETCRAVAEGCRNRSIPFCLYSGDLAEAGELVSSLKAPLIQKPASDRTIVTGVAELFDVPG